MGFLADLFGAPSRPGPGGEASFAQVERTLRLRGDDRNRVLASYLIMYAETGFDCAVDGDWEAAAVQYSGGADQVPGDLASVAPFDTMQSLLAYNAIVCRILGRGLTADLQTEVEQRLAPPKGLFARKVTPLQTAVARQAAFLLLASGLHRRHEYEAAAVWYSAGAAPAGDFGLEAARRLRKAVNRMDLPPEYWVPGVVKLSLKGNLTLLQPVATKVVVYASGEGVASRLDIPMLQQGINFEERCVQLVRAMGFVAHTTEKTGDGGIDILARSTLPLLSGEVVIQCKDWRAPVGEPILRDLYGVVSARQAIKGICITSGTFTQKAKDFAQGLQLELVDGAQLNYWLGRYMDQGEQEAAAGDAAPQVPALTSATP